MSDERGGEGTSGSAFDAANDLLQAALDEVRGIGATPRSQPAPSGAERAATQPARGPAAVVEPELWAPQPGQPKRSSGARRSRRTAPPAGGPATPTTPATPATPAAEAATAHRARRRARRRVDDPAAVDAATSPGEEFDGLSDLFRPTEPPRRRAAKASPAKDTGPVAPTAAAGTPTVETEASPRAQDQRARPSATSGTAAAGAAVAASATASGSSAPTAPSSTGATSKPTETQFEPVLAAKPTAARLDPVVAAAGRGEVAPAPGPAPTRPRTKQLVAALVVAALVVGAVGIALTSGGGGSDGRDTALDTPPGSRLTFPATTTPEGAEMTRVWDLRGASGNRFVGRLQFENPTSSVLQVTHTETIPKTLAASVSDIRFDPQPVVVNPDPVVRYSLSLPPGGSTTVRYFIEVPPLGPDRDRLETWADDLPTTTTTTSTPRSPVTTPVTTPTSAAGSNRATGGGGGGGGGGSSSSGSGSGAAPNNPPAPGNPNPPGPTSPPATTPPTVPPTTTPPTTAPPQTGSLVIWMRSKDGTGQFSFSTPFGPVALDTGPGNGEASTGFTVDVGKYPVTLQVPDGWTFVGISCNAGGSASGTTATFDITPGAAVRCTFTVRH